MRASKLKRKRERQQARYAKRPKPPKPVVKPVAPSRGLISEAAIERLSPLAQAIRIQALIIQR
jgi:hypothetical protein